jgi:hypothetical protein
MAQRVQSTTVNGVGVGPGQDLHNGAVVLLDYLLVHSKLWWFLTAREARKEPKGLSLPAAGQMRELHTTAGCKPTLGTRHSSSNIASLRPVSRPMCMVGW